MQDKLPPQIQTALAHDGGLTAVLEQTIAHLGADSGTIHLVGADGQLHLEAHHRIAGPVLTIIGTIAVGKGMAGLAVERGEPITVCNIQTDDSGDVRPGAKATAMQGAIVVPVQRDGISVGALGVANRAERTFTAEEITLLTSVGHAIAERQA